MAEILLADDEEVIRDIASRTLGRAGHNVYRCGSVAELLESYRTEVELSQPYDMIVTDNDMGPKPEEKGLCAVKVIRKSEEGSGRHTPILMITGDLITAELKAKSEELDFYILEKPFTPPQLVEKVRECLGD